MATADLSSGLFLPGHSFRDSVHDEFIEVARLGFDDQNRIFEQLHHYLVSDPASVAEVPYWTAILLRDHRNPKVRAAMELWTAHMLRYSRRDQLSLNTVLRAVGLKPDVWEVDNHTSWFHIHGRMPRDVSALPACATQARRWRRCYPTAAGAR